MGLLVYRSSLWQILCLLVMVFGVVVPCLLLAVTLNVDSSDRHSYYLNTEHSVHSLSTHERKPLDYPLADPREASELRHQIRELEAIRLSVRDELRVFEQQRSKLSSDIESHKESLARVKKELTAAKIDLQDKRGQLSKVNRDFYDKVDPITQTPASLAPIIVLPAENKMSSLSELSGPGRGAPTNDVQFSRCTIDLCFNLGRCPLTRHFSVFVYNDANPHLFHIARHGNVVTDYVTELKRTGSFTSDPSAACVFVAIIENRASTGEEAPRHLQTKIQSLPHWGAEGANHVLIELSTSRDTASSLEDISTGRAIISRSIVSSTKPFRPGFDVLIPPLPTSEVTWRDLPPLLPVSRENLIYFHGEYAPSRYPTPSSLAPADIKSLQQALDGREKIDIQLTCPESGVGVIEGEWMLCGGQTSRLELCSQSTFSLVPSPGGSGNTAGVTLCTRLVESLICGSIPVLIGVGALPFDEVIDWRRAAISIPSGGFSDIHYILRSVSQDDIQNLRLNGRNLWSTYFSSPLAVAKATVAMVRSRTLHPPPLAPEFVGISLLTKSTSRKKRIPSPLLTHNFTTYSWGFWNDPPGPFLSYPATPFTRGPLSGYQFSELDERAIARLPLHIVDGGGVTGPNFEDLLLGNSPEEQFTIVMLTYQRNLVLMEALARLEEVSYLNKVIVVWNNEENPPNDLEWPDIGVPIEVRLISRVYSGTSEQGALWGNSFVPRREVVLSQRVPYWRFFYCKVLPQGCIDLLISKFHCSLM